jgi:hypothetical protein
MKGQEAHARPPDVFKLTLDLKDELRRFKGLPAKTDAKASKAAQLCLQRKQLDIHIARLTAKEKRQALSEEEITDLCSAQDLADDMDFLGLKAVATQRSAQSDRNNGIVVHPHNRLGSLVKVSPKLLSDPVLRVEQNVGCELPVCVSNRRDVKKHAIEIRMNGGTVWKLKRVAGGSLPAPEHFKIWLWFLDRCQAACYADPENEDPPRISIDLKELKALFGNEGGGGSGGWYRNIDEALCRFSELVISVHDSYYTPNGIMMTGKANMGTLCSYVSWREKRGNEQVGQFETNDRGWIAPGPLLWASIRGGYIKAVPFRAILDVPYVAQRLVTYLMKHCKPDAAFKVRLEKLLPKIPLEGPIKACRRRLASHHEVLFKIGFLATPPVFEGRGTETMVIYERAQH